MPGKLSQILICSFLLLLLVSCSPGKEPTENTVPAEIIQPDSMVNILTEIHIAEAILREVKADSKHKEKKAEVYFAEIFEKHKVTRDQYEKSIEFYQQRLDIYKDIYEEVITLLSQKQSLNTSEK
jgi:hypothetical protein